MPGAYPPHADIYNLVLGTVWCSVPSTIPESLGVVDHEAEDEIKKLEAFLKDGKQKKREASVEVRRETGLIRGDATIIGVTRQTDS